jgi:hypothetical protein
MLNLQALVNRLETLHRQHFTIEHEIAEVKREIVAAGPKPRKKPTSSVEAIELIKPTVKVLQEAGEPLPRREIASRLGIASVAADYRLRKAVAAGFVEKLSGGRYRVSTDVPAL